MRAPIDDNPRPRGLPASPRPLPEFPVSRVYRCRPLVQPAECSFTSVVERRRSRTEMRRAPLAEIANVVAFAVQPRQVLHADPYGRTRRISPSAGALHPVEVLMVHGSARVYRYAPDTHELERLTVLHPRELALFRADCAEILPRALGTAIVLAGDLNRVASLYEQPESLMWRDAGALFQTVALSATAYGFAFCPLGTLGTPVLRAIEREEHLSAAGVGIIGRPVGTGSA